MEAYLLDFDRDIYGETMTLEFVARLRDDLGHRHQRVDERLRRQLGAQLLG